MDTQSSTPLAHPNPLPSPLISLMRPTIIIFFISLSLSSSFQSYLYIHYTLTYTHNSSKREREMTIDDSFKKPGAIPFKWEIRPGVPKLHHQSPSPQQSPSFNLRRSLLQHHEQQKQQSFNHHRSCPTTPIKLSPPPSGFHFRPPPPEPRSRSTPRGRPDRSIFAPPDNVGSGSCFPSPLVLIRRKGDKKRSRRPKPESDFEPDYTSDLETLSRWSGSTRKSVSLFRDSPSSSFSSYRSSPRPVSDDEWAWLGLF